MFGCLLFCFLWSCSIFIDLYGTNASGEKKLTHWPQYLKNIFYLFIFLVHHATWDFPSVSCSEILVKFAQIQCMVFLCLPSHHHIAWFIPAGKSGSCFFSFLCVCCFLVQILIYTDFISTILQGLDRTFILRNKQIINCLAYYFSHKSMFPSFTFSHWCWHQTEAL